MEKKPNTIKLREKNKMKKHITLLVLCAINLCYSQAPSAFSISKNSWLLGGQVNYSTNKDEDVTNTQLLIAPRAGYAVANNLVIGLGLSYLKTKEETDSDLQFEVFDTESNFLGITPYITKYYPITKALFFDVEARLSYFTGQTEDTSFESDTSIFSVSILPGITYSVHRKLAFTLNLGGLAYSKSTFNTKSSFFGPEEETQSEENNFGVDFQTANLSIGFIYLLH